MDRDIRGVHKPIYTQMRANKIQITCGNSFRWMTIHPTEQKWNKAHDTPVSETFLFLPQMCPKKDIIKPVLWGYLCETYPNKWGP